MIVTKDKCVGCGLCSVLCPFESIKMQRDQLGYRYPMVDNETCKKCNICKRNCPQLRENIHQDCNRDFGTKCYVAVNKDSSIAFASSSGGAVTALIDSFPRNEDVWICAAAYDNDFTVRHELVESGKDFSKFRKSKYVQSDTFQCFTVIKERLSMGCIVVYIGTPCQVDALKTYLGRKDDRLYTIDVLCTGVGSPALLDLHIRFLQNKRKKKVISYDMRSKVQRRDKSWNVMDCSIGYSDDTSEKNPIYKKMFKEIFYKHISLRPSCYSCKYKSRERMGDITIGDWWGDVTPIRDEYQGASAVIINSNKGQELFAKAESKLDYFTVGYDEIIAQQPALREKNMPMRSINMIKENEILKFMLKNAAPEPVEIIKSVVKMCLPSGIKNKIIEFKKQL